MLTSVDVVQTEVANKTRGWLCTTGRNRKDANHYLHKVRCKSSHNNSTIRTNTVRKPSCIVEGRKGILAWISPPVAVKLGTCPCMPYPRGCEYEFGNWKPFIPLYSALCSSSPPSRVAGEPTAELSFESEFVSKKLRDLDSRWHGRIEVGKHWWCCRSTRYTCRAPALRKDEAERTGYEVLSGLRRDLRRVGVPVVRVRVGRGADGAQFELACESVPSID